MVYISIHSLYAEGDKNRREWAGQIYYFNPLPLRRGRRYVVLGLEPCAINFNPLPLRRGRHSHSFIPKRRMQISIHSLYAEGDFSRLKTLIQIGYFNPLPLRRGRQHRLFWNFPMRTFQSTPSTQRETATKSDQARIVLFQSTPSTQRETEQNMKKQ